MAEEAIPPGQSFQDIWEALEVAKPHKCLPAEGCPLLRNLKTVLGWGIRSCSS